MLKNKRISSKSENDSVVYSSRNETKRINHEKLYAQQKLLRQKNLVNRLKLSLLNIFKNLQIDDSIIKTDAYLNLSNDEISSVCSKFINQCVYEKLIFDNMMEQFKGKVEFDTVKQILEDNKARFMQVDKENYNMLENNNSQQHERKSFYSGSENISNDQINN